jgi:hypothetical protein
MGTVFKQQKYMEVEGEERPAEMPVGSWLLSSLEIYDVLAKRVEQILAPGMQASRYSCSWLFPTSPWQ